MWDAANENGTNAVLFSDGSAYGVSTEVHAAAGGAAVLALPSCDEPVAVIEAAVPKGSAQNGQSGEFLGCILANRIANILMQASADSFNVAGVPPASFKPSLVSDCTAVVNMMRDPEDTAWSCRAMHAGAARDIMIEGNAICRTSHVYSHLADRGGRADGRTFDQDARATRFNQCVDVAAKRAAAAHFPSEAVIGQFDNDLKLAKTFLRGVAALLSEWPSNTELFGKLDKATVGPKPPNADGSHVWTYVGSRRWQCECCLRTTRKPAASANGCDGPSLRFLNVLGEPRGHHLWAARLEGGDRGFFVYCTRCALFGSARMVKGLAQRCRGAPNGVNGRRQASMFADGRHPLYGEFSRPWPLEVYTFAAAEANECTYDVLTPFANPVAPAFGFDDPEWQPPQDEHSESD